MSKPDDEIYPQPAEPPQVIIKGTPISAQAERLIKVRRELSKAEDMTRAELIEEEARKRAEQIIADAEKRAQELIEEAGRQADSILSKAYQEGEAAGRVQSLNRLEELISSLKKEINLLQNQRSEFLRQNLPGIVAFACALAERILIAEIKSRPEVIADRACALLERMPPDSHVVLSICPEELETVERFIQASGGHYDTLMVSLRSDPSLSRGSIRLESDTGRIDADFLEALERVGQVLIDQARHQQELLKYRGESAND